MAEKTVLNKVTFEYKIGSNIVTVNNEKKYLNVIVWTPVTYEEIKDNIVG